MQNRGKVQISTSKLGVLGEQKESWSLVNKGREVQNEVWGFIGEEFEF